MSDPLVLRVLSDYRRRLAEREAAQFADLARRWAALAGRLDPLIEALAEEIAASDPAQVTRGQVARLERYRVLMAQVDAEFARFNDQAEGSITRAQGDYAAQGVRAAQDAIEAAQYDAGVTGAFSRLPARAVETMAGLASDGSPLAVLLGQSYPLAVRQLTDALLTGVGLGWGPAKLARELRRIADLPLNRALRIARTEELRAYREASRQQYTESGVVRGYKRVCAKSARTCLACLVLDGQFYPLETPFEEHVCGRCVAIPCLQDLPDVQWQTGTAWLEQQPPNVQREIMGTGRWQAWKDGLPLGEMVGVRQDATWGAAPYVRSVSKLPTAKKTVGFSFFRGRSPLSSVAQARAVGEGANGWQANRAVFFEMLKRHKLIDDIANTLGLWGNPEPSFNAWVKGQAENVLAFAREWGKTYEQEAMALLLPNPEGAGGALAWDFGRALGDTELDKLLGAVREVNARIAAEQRSNYFELGLTVREDRRIEFWVGDVEARSLGEAVFDEVARLAGLAIVKPEWEGGYDFRLLFKGSDY